MSEVQKCLFPLGMCIGTGISQDATKKLWEQEIFYFVAQRKTPHAVERNYELDWYSWGWGSATARIHTTCWQVLSFMLAGAGIYTLESFSVFQGTIVVGFIFYKTNKHTNPHKTPPFWFSVHHSHFMFKSGPVYTSVISFQNSILK